MFIKIPFESTIEFKTNISEITKMSLEQDYNLSGSSVLGNFYISGEYKTHEVSVNKEPFKYTLPFTVEISDRIKEDSLEFNIEDFSYEVVDNNKLKINIEYSLAGEEREELEEEDLFERVNEDELETELNIIDDFLDKEDGASDEKEETFKDNLEELLDKSEEEKEVEEDERLTKDEEKTIMETIKQSDDTFVTYHVHIVKESESFESISTIYGVPSSLVKEYNNMESLTVGDKVLIPKADE